MSKFSYASICVLAGILLVSGCGGGASSGSTAQTAAAPLGVDASGVTVAGEARVTVDKAAFARLQRGCSAQRSRMYIVDDAYVFWDTDGRCPGAENAFSLYYVTPEEPVCTQLADVSGMGVNCSNKGTPALFTTMIQHRGQPGLGLGSGHTVELLAQPAPADGAHLVFETLLHDDKSGVLTERQVLVQDAAAWQALWQEMHAGQADQPPLPKIDFSRSFVAAVFLGARQPGMSLKIERVSIEQQHTLIEYSLQPANDSGYVSDYQPDAGPAQHVVQIERSERTPVFRRIATQRQPFKRMGVKLEMQGRSAVGFPTSVPAEPYNAVIRDSRSWLALWARHSDKAPPYIDFSKEMVVLAYGGVQPDSCHRTRIAEVARSGDKLYVARVMRVPRQQEICQIQAAATGEMVRLARSDDTVVFGSQNARPDALFWEE